MEISFCTMLTTYLNTRTNTPTHTSCLVKCTPYTPKLFKISMFFGWGAFPNAKLYTQYNSFSAQVMQHARYMWVIHWSTSTQSRKITWHIVERCFVSSYLKSQSRTRPFSLSLSLSLPDIFVHMGGSLLFQILIYHFILNVYSNNIWKGNGPSQKME